MFLSINTPQLLTLNSKGFNHNQVKTLDNRQILGIIYKVLSSKLKQNIRSNK